MTHVIPIAPLAYLIRCRHGKLELPNRPAPLLDLSKACSCLTPVAGRGLINPLYGARKGGIMIRYEVGPRR